MRTIESIGRHQPKQRRAEKQKSIDDDAAARSPAQRDKGFCRRHAEKIDREATRNIVPMERPRILDGDRIGKYRAIAVYLQLVA